MDKKKNLLFNSDLQEVYQPDKISREQFTKLIHEIMIPIEALNVISSRASMESIDDVKKTVLEIKNVVNYLKALFIDIEAMTKEEYLDINQTIEPFSISNEINTVLKMIDGENSVILTTNLSSQYVGNKTRFKTLVINFLTALIKINNNNKITINIVEKNRIASHAVVSFKVNNIDFGTDDCFEEKSIDRLLANKKLTIDDKTRLEKGLTLINLIGGNVHLNNINNIGSLSIELLFNVYEIDEEKVNNKGETNFNGLHALVVDDSEMNRKIVCSILEHESITFEEAENGQVAYDIFISNDKHFDFILMDIKMPGVDGIKATKMIRNSRIKNAKNIPIIAISANGFSSDMMNAHYAGIDSYTTKPIDKDKLLLTIVNLIKNK